MVARILNIYYLKFYCLNDLGADLRDLAVTKDSRSGLTMHSMKGTMTIPHLPLLV